MSKIHDWISMIFIFVLRHVKCFDLNLLCFFDNWKRSKFCCQVSACWINSNMITASVDFPLKVWFLSRANIYKEMPVELAWIWWTASIAFPLTVRVWDMILVKANICEQVHVKLAWIWGIQFTEFLFASRFRYDSWQEQACK